jgi:hypothetical protein
LGTIPQRAIPMVVNLEGAAAFADDGDQAYFGKRLVISLIRIWPKISSWECERPSGALH